MKIKLSGITAEILKAESFEYSDSMEVKTLIKVLQSKSEIINSTKLCVAINEELANEQQIFTENDNVFVFNPIAGG